jgi:hypothetical protein
MFDIFRCRSTVAVGASLGLAVLVINFALLAATGRFSRFLVPEHIPMGWNYIEENDARVAGVLAEVAKRELRSTQSLGIYIGKSTARSDIDSATLDANDGLNCRYLGLCGEGAGMQDLGVLACPLFASDLKPFLALVCIHPAFLAGAAPQNPETPLNPLPSLATGRWREAVVIALHWNWIQGERTNVNHAIRTALYNLRVRVFNDLHLNQDAFCSPDPHPWRPFYPETPDARDPDAEVSKRIRQEEEVGWFDVMQFDKYRQNTTKVLIDVILGFRSRGAEVVVVLMPETTLIRDRIPTEARRYLEEDLTRAFATATPRLLDFRQSMGDTMFRDHIHLNSAGRKEFSLLLARAIKEHMEKRQESQSVPSPAKAMRSSGSLPTGQGESTRESKTLWTMNHCPRRPAS